MNEYTGKASRWRYTTLKRQTDERISLWILKAKLMPMPSARVKFHWVEKNQKRDPDNICSATKFILDALVTMKILPTDGWRGVTGLAHEFSIDAAKPGVRVTLETGEHGGPTDA